MKGQNFQRFSYTIVVSGLLWAVSFSYNACSDVEFSNVGTNGVSRAGVPEDPSDPQGPYTPPTDGPPRDYEIVDKYLDYLVPEGTTNKVDIFIAFDNSGSMKIENSELGERMGNFTQVLDLAQIDWQICHTTTDFGTHKGLAQKWQGHNSIVLKSTQQGRETIFKDTAKNIIKTNGSGDEQGIRALNTGVKAIENSACFRSDAALATIVISDEDERSGGLCDKDLYKDQRQLRQCKTLLADNFPSHLLETVANEFPEKIYTHHSILIRPDDQSCFDKQDAQEPAFFGFLNTELSEMTGGIVGDICAENYANQLQDMGIVTERSLEAVPLECAPIETPQVVITPALGTTYRVEGQKVFFTPALPSGTRVEVNYKCYRDVI